MKRLVRTATSRERALAFAVTAVLSSLAGCTPQIGDECDVSTDCSQQGDRLCDGSQPGGYCTVFGCEPDGCPDNSVCVGFGLQLDPACQTEGTDPRWPRFERTFCLATCEEDSDCRDAYVCLAPADRAAQGIDVESEWRASKVCFVAAEFADDNGVEPGVCAQSKVENEP